MRVPVEAEALCLVANELNLGVDFAKGGGLKGVLCSVKDEDLAVDTEGGNDVGVLGLVSGLVDLARVLDLLDNVALDGGHVSGFSVSTNLAALLIVVVGIRRHSLRDLNVGNLDKVGALIGRVGAEE